MLSEGVSQSNGLPAQRQGRHQPVGRDHRRQERADQEARRRERSNEMHRRAARDAEHRGRCPYECLMQGAPPGRTRQRISCPRFGLRAKVEVAARGYNKKSAGRTKQGMSGVRGRRCRMRSACSARPCRMHSAQGKRDAVNQYGIAECIRGFAAFEMPGRSFNGGRCAIRAAPHRAVASSSRSH